jgi:lipoprotein LprG
VVVPVLETRDRISGRAWRAGLPQFRMGLSRGVAILLVTSAICAGCGKESNVDSATAVPQAEGLLAASASAMSTVVTLRFSLNVGNAGSVTLRHAEGVITREGSAQGTAKTGEAEIPFVIIGQNAWVKYGPGGYQKLSLAMVPTLLDPMVYLDPERGFPKLLRTATMAKTEGTEMVNGRDTYRVRFRASANALTALIPGTGNITDGRVWLDMETHRIAKCEFIYAATGDNPGPTVTVAVFDYDAPVTINAPSQGMM